MIPVITIDGTSGVGKGTVAKLMAQQFGWHYLDSGAMYRVLAWAALHEAINVDEHAKIQHLLDTIQITMPIGTEDHQVHIFCNEHEISGQIRTEEVGNMASKISALPFVRTALLQLQRDFQKTPGLVTDGRDMGTVVFPKAPLKLFLAATPHERAKRRAKQLKEQGIDVSLAEIESQLRARDERDQNRAVAPLRAASDAIQIDTSDLSIDQVLAKALELAHNKLGILP